MSDAAKGTGGRTRIFSGIQPTGSKHLGNLIGGVRQYVEGQEVGDSIYCLVDLHAITVKHDPPALRQQVHDTVSILIAAGLDPDRCILFRQSDVAEHTYLCWLLSSVTAYGELGRMTQFKEKSAEQKEFVSAGLFFYPVLQAADILAYQTDEVPVGEDQKQHIELARTIGLFQLSMFGIGEFQKVMFLFIATVAFVLSDTHTTSCFLYEASERAALLEENTANEAG